MDPQSRPRQDYTCAPRSGSRNRPRANYELCQELLEPCSKTPQELGSAREYLVPLDTRGGRQSNSLRRIGTRDAHGHVHTEPRPSGRGHNLVIMLNWLVVGVGDITTKRVIPAILAETRSKLIGIVTRDPRKAEAYGVPSWSRLDDALVE